MVNKALIFGGIAILIIIIIIIILLLVIRPRPPPPTPTPTPTLLPISPPNPTPNGTTIPIVTLTPSGTTTPNGTSVPNGTTIPIITSTPIITYQQALERCQQQYRASGGNPDLVNFINPLRDCAFQYKPTVGCPPAPKQLPDPSSPQGQTIVSSRQNNNWKQQTDSAWLLNPGNNPSICRPNVFYYGKTNNADLCKQKCQLDLECKSWMYNSNNHAFPDIQTGSCWGANAIEPIKTGRVGGFISGGY